MQKTTQVKSSRSMSFQLKTISAAVVSALLVAHASAAGLGKLTVLSGLGQPLRAEIELTAVTAEEARTLQPKLASMDAFRQANIEFNPALLALRFAIEQRGSKQLIRITSQQAISEPFVDVLLELNGANGRLVREYTFLLDPPELRALQPAQTAPVVIQNTPPPAAVSTPLPVPSPERSVAGARSPEPAAPVAVARPKKPAAANQSGVTASKPAGDKAGASEYKVLPGDSLSKIANRTKAEGVSLDQMLVSLYRANPDAFIGENMNRLRAGQILAVPSTAVSTAVGTPDAHGIVIAQATDFNDYRNKLAGQVATGPSRKPVENRQSASGKIAAKVEEKPSAANESVDKLKLSKADAAAVGKTAAAQEDKIARDKAAADAAARVKDLEKNVSELQRLLEVKNKDLADRQKQADTANAKPAVVDVANAKQAAAESAAVAAAAVLAAKPLASAAAPGAAPSATAVAKPVVTPPVTPAAPAATVTPTAKPKPASVKVVEEPGAFDDPLNNPLLQGAAAVLLLLLGGFAFFRSRASKKTTDFQNSTITDSSLKTNSLFGSTGGQSVDTNNSVFNSNFAPSASTLDSNEVDPVAEADVYIAYGRDAQAEEILKEALRTQPERQAVRVKLLEIYATRKDVRAFESVATELYSMTKGEGDEWSQAAAMGLALDPDNPMYASAKSAVAVASTTGAVLLMTPTLPVDDHAELDAFLEEVSSTQRFPDSGLVPDAEKSAEAPVPVMTTNAVRLPQETSVPVASVAVAHDDPLDFDLNGLNFDVIPTPPAIPTGLHEGRHEPVLPPMAAAEPELDDAPLSALDFDFLQNEKADDAPNAPAATTTVVAHAAEPAHATAAAMAPEPVTMGEFDLASHDAGAHALHDNSMADDLPLSPRTVAARPDPLEFDLSGITLDLPSTPPVAPLALDTTLINPASTSIARDDFTELDLDTGKGADDGVSSGSISNSAEMATKLDLAVAYQEIGDKEGARELLDEVVNGGTGEQADKARSILARLG